jgi:hypothetical protein
MRTHPSETVIDLVHQPIEVRRDAEARRMAHNSCLHELAEKIPSMGGTEIGALLREAARNAPSNTAIVEVGCWLGAGTAQLALGIRERQNPATVQLHTYDRWQASQREVEKAAKSGWRLSIGENTLPRVSQTLSHFIVPIQFHKGDLIQAVWEDGPISVYVDDASKAPLLFANAIETFAPHWIPGETIIFLMDFNLWKTTGSRKHKSQKRFMERYRYAFERINAGAAAAFTPLEVFRYVEATDFSPWLNQTRRAAARRKLVAKSPRYIARVACGLRARLVNWLAPPPKSHNLG